MFQPRMRQGVALGSIRFCRSSMSKTCSQDRLKTAFPASELRVGTTNSSITIPFETEVGQVPIGSPIPWSAQMATKQTKLISGGLDLGTILLLEETCDVFSHAAVFRSGWYRSKADDYTVSDIGRQGQSRLSAVRNDCESQIVLDQDYLPVVPRDRERGAPRRLYIDELPARPLLVGGPAREAPVAGPPQPAAPLPAQLHVLAGPAVPHPEVVTRQVGDLLPRSDPPAADIVVRHVQSPYVQRLVPASDDGAILLNTVVVNNGGNDQGEPLVLTHGYGSGLGFWATVLDALATATSRPIIAVDWNGMGASSRTPFTKYRHGGADANEAAANAESYFIEPFERWRQEMGIEKMALCGHSLGGFLSAAYATKHPDRVSNLIMVSPAGLLSQPDGSRLPADTLTFQQKLLALGWANNITPQSIVRAVGPWGHRLTDRMVRARFHAMKEDDLEVLSAYLYGITSAPPVRARIIVIQDGIVTW